MDNISFKANYINNAKVMKLTANNEYKKIPAVVVELNIKSKEDLKTLKKVASRWALGDIYARDVYERFKANTQESQEIPQERFFALTTQLKDHNELKPHKILGVAELYKPSEEKTEIEFLQADPKYQNPFVPREIIGIGYALIEELLNVIKDKEVVLFTTPKAKSLYEKFGFKNVESNLMILKR